jgi:hypothetical protein
VGAENCVTSCDRGVFVDQSAKPVSSQDPHIRIFCGRIGSPRWWVLVQRPAWPVGVVVIGVLAQDEPQMPFTSDQHPIQAFVASATYPAFGDRVRARRLYGCGDDPDSDGGERGVQRRGELGVPVMDQELEAGDLIAMSMSRLRACWVTQVPVGWAVIPARCTRRVACSMNSKTYRRRRMTVST